MTDLNPVLVDVTRGRLVECAHRGALAVARPSGELLVSIGDVGRPVFPRSAIKAFQALPLIESGAAERYGFGAAEIALACASHSGSERHTATASAMLARAGRAEPDLGCGAHAPLGDDEFKAFQAAGATATALHNNCSGKHAGMVCLACHLGAPVADYLELAHPVQRGVHRVLEQMSGTAIGVEHVGIDGCSAPNFALPLAAMATAFARFASRDGVDARRRAAIERISESCWKAPEMVAGRGRLDTRLMEAFPGKIFSKTGAEGVYCAALPEHGIGIAIKADDGAKRASETMVLAVLERLVAGLDKVAPSMTRLHNARGTLVGEVRPSTELSAALDKLKG